MSEMKDAVTTMLERSLKRLGKAGSELALECQSSEEALAVATAYVQCAKTIYRDVGGAKLSAKILYSHADGEAAEAE